MRAQIAPAAGSEQDSVKNNGRKSTFASESPFMTTHAGRDYNFFGSRYGIKHTKSEWKQVNKKIIT